ncbi:MAG TPA: DNA primase [Candidatus Saccharimonadales bacterium]|jgi:DNA primase
MNAMQGEAKEEVRSRLDIEAVIGEYVVLKRAGRNWKGLSPFSQEKSPSFFVSPDKGIWHDFSSNQGGDVYSFVMAVEGLDFRGALELLARKAGVDLSQFQGAAADKGLSRKRDRLRAMHDLATIYYQRSLFSTPIAVDYVKGRGLDRQVVHDFRLGYAPADGRSLQRFLLGKGYTTPELKDGGLIGSRGTDLFRDRLMVPLMDPSGTVIGFTARLIADVKNAPKYLNTPQTILYDKGRHVFGLHLAKEAIRTGGRGVIVEGNLDVISSHQAGVKEVVATAGTALTDAHLKALGRLSERVILGFDGDKAGIAATERAIPMAQAASVELSVVTLPDDAKDPDELIQQDVALWRQALDDAKPAIDWLIGRYEARLDLATAGGKRRLTTDVLALLGKLDNPVEQEHYLRLLGEKTDTSQETLRARMGQLAQAVPARKAVAVQASAPSAEVPPDARQDHLLSLLISDADMRDAVLELSIDALTGDARQALLRYIVHHPDAVPLRGVPDELHAYGTYVKIVQFKAETMYNDLSSAERLTTTRELVRHLKLQYRKKKIAELSAELRVAETSSDDVTATRLRGELNNLIREETPGAKKTN